MGKNGIVVRAVAAALGLLGLNCTESQAVSLQVEVPMNDAWCRCPEANAVVFALHLVQDNCWAAQ